MLLDADIVFVVRRFSNRGLFAAAGSLSDV